MAVNAHTSDPAVYLKKEIGRPHGALVAAVSPKASELARRLAILGATGDLTARYLLPALGALWAGGKLGDDFQLVVVGRDNWTDETFRNWAAAQKSFHRWQSMPWWPARAIIRQA